jgi:hypothetical protein
MGTPAFNDAAKKIQDEERAADAARAADVEERARAEMSARRPGASNPTAVLANTLERADGARERRRDGMDTLALESGGKGPTRERALFDTVAASMGVDSASGYTPDIEKKIRETMSLYSTVGAGQADQDVLKRTMAEPGYKAYAKEQDTFAPKAYQEKHAEQDLKGAFSSVPDYSPLASRGAPAEKPAVGPTLENAPGAKEAEARMAEIEAVLNPPGRGMYAATPAKKGDAALEAEYRQLYKQRYGREYLK